LDFFIHEKDAIFVFMKNMLVKILEFGHMQQKIYIFYFEIFLFFFEIFRRKLGILIPDLYFTVYIYNLILCKIGRNICEKNHKFFLNDF